MIAYSASTGHYTVDQIDGLACRDCAELFRPGQPTKRVAVGIGYQLYAHVQCPKARTSR